MRPRTISLRAATVEKLARLMREAESDGARRVARRIHAVTLNAGGRTSGDTADTLMVGRSRVSGRLRGASATATRRCLKARGPVARRRSARRTSRVSQGPPGLDIIRLLGAVCPHGMDSAVSA